MKLTAFIFALCLALLSCSKGGSNSGTEPTPTPVNNGPIGGTYSFTTAVTKAYDTIPGSGITTINEYTTTGSNLKGSIVITAGAINSKGLMFDYTRTGNKKEVNTSNNNTITTNYSPQSGSSGATTTSYTSNYTINTTTGELTVDDGTYLFCPAFLSQPANKKHSYTLTGNVLKVTSVHYDASAKYRTVHEATFTKQ